MRSFVLLLSTVTVIGCGGSGSPGDIDGADMAVAPDLLGAPPTVLSGSLSSDATLFGSVTLAANVIVPSGVTLTLGAGVEVRAAADVSLEVAGKLVAAGSSDAPVRWVSDADSAAGQWRGIQASSGGRVELTWSVIRDADVAFVATAGSGYALDHVTIERSNAIASLAADGTVKHGTFHALGAAQAAGPIEIDSASPQLSDTLVDKANGRVDMITIVGGGASAPVFDHMEVTGAHCAFHFNQGDGPTITNSYVHNVAYGLMVVGATNVRIEGDQFDKNSVNIGACQGGSVEATNTYFSGQAFDQSCSSQGNTAPATSPPVGVGVRP